MSIPVQEAFLAPIIRVLQRGSVHKANKCNFRIIAGIKPGVVTTGVTGPTSQIPGLSQSVEADNTPAERISGRRVGIFESDSDYVKLAKGGGHKGKGHLVLLNVF